MERFWYVFQVDNKEVYRTTAENLSNARKQMRSGLFARGWTKESLQNVYLMTNVTARLQLNQ